MRTIMMVCVAATPLLLGGSVTAAETYQIDPAHSSLNFSVRHLGINNVKGHFDKFSGEIMMEGTTLRQAQCTIDVASIDTGVKMRDDHLRTADFFDAEKHPEITFKTRSIETKEGETTLVGDFTIRGVTKRVRLPVELSGPIKDQTGKTRIGLEGKLEINRKDYGINFNAALETGVALVGEKVTIEVNLEAVESQDEN